MSANINGVRFLRLLREDLEVFSTDRISLMKRNLPGTRFQGTVITALINARERAVTPDLYGKFERVKAGLIEYLDEKIDAIEHDSEARDPWILLKDHLTLPMDVSPQKISDHVQDVLTACSLVAMHQFSSGAASVGDEILQLKSKLTSVYLPAIHQLPDDSKRDELLAALEGLDNLIEEMGTELKSKRYEQVLESYTKIQDIFSRSNLIAKNWIASFS